MNNLLSFIFDSTYIFISLVMFLIFLIALTCHYFFKNNEKAELELKKQELKNIKEMKEIEKGKINNIIARGIAPSLDIKSPILSNTKEFSLYELEEELKLEENTINSYLGKNILFKYSYISLFKSDTELEPKLSGHKSILNLDDLKENNLVYNSLSKYLNEDLEKHLTYLYETLEQNYIELYNSINYISKTKSINNKAFLIDKELKNILINNTNHYLKYISLINKNNIETKFAVGVNKNGVYFIRLIENIPDKFTVTVSNNGYWIVNDREMNIYMSNDSIIQSEEIIEMLEFMNIKNIPIHCVYAFTSDISIVINTDNYKNKDGYYLIKLNSLDTLLNNSFNMLNINKDNLLKNNEIDNISYKLLSKVVENEKYKFRPQLNSAISNIENIDIILNRIEKINNIYKKVL